MYEKGSVVFLETIFKLLNPAVAHKNIGPHGVIREMTSSHPQTRSYLRFSKTIAHGRMNILSGCRKRISTVRFHKFHSTLCRWQ